MKWETLLCSAKAGICHVHFSGAVCLEIGKIKEEASHSWSPFLSWWNVCAFFTEKLSPERVKLVMEHIWRMQEFCNSMLKLSPDSYEYAYLKAIVLFSPGAYISWQFTKFKWHSFILCTQTRSLERAWKRGTACAYTHASPCVHFVFPSDHPGIDNTPQIERFQEKAYMELQDYVTRTYPEDSYRSVGFTFNQRSACWC